MKVTNKAYRRITLGFVLGWIAAAMVAAKWLGGWYAGAALVAGLVAGIILIDHLFATDRGPNQHSIHDDNHTA